jgi:hypothetical protein
VPHVTITLTNGTPLLDVAIGVSQPRQSALVAAGQQVPAPMLARLLVDTGASHTCLDHTVITRLGLTQTGTVLTHTPTTGTAPQTMPQYDASITLLHTNLTRTFGAVPVSASNFMPQGFQGLLGRDILKECMLIYSGPDNAFMLSI